MKYFQHFEAKDYIFFLLKFIAEGYEELACIECKRLVRALRKEGLL